MKIYMFMFLKTYKLFCGLEGDKGYIKHTINNKEIRVGDIRNAWG